MSSLEMPNPDHIEHVFSAVEQLGFDPAEAANNQVLAKFMTKLFQIAEKRDGRSQAWTAQDAEMSAAYEIEEYSKLLDTEHEVEQFRMHTADTVEEVIFELDNAEE